MEAARALPAGEHQVRMEFAYAGGGLGKGGQVTLYIDGEKVGEGAIPMTQAMVFSADDGCDVGEDSAALLPPLPPGRASSGASRYLDEPCRFPLRPSPGEHAAMTDARFGAHRCEPPFSTLPPYPARAGCATAAGSRRTRWAPPGRVPVFS